mmetsp:Transcript_39439/g.85818  ORF Transcript_39439/g.85818 Transcript_39439/m.85818 type:complete len:208 (-) Transcript_39439:5555-6178(-)
MMYAQWEVCRPCRNKCWNSSLKLPVTRSRLLLETWHHTIACARAVASGLSPAACNVGSYNCQALSIARRRASTPASACGLAPATIAGAPPIAAPSPSWVSSHTAVWRSASGRLIPPTCEVGSPAGWSGTSSRRSRASAPLSPISALARFANSASSSRRGVAMPCIICTASPADQNRWRTCPSEGHSIWGIPPSMNAPPALQCFHSAP